MELFWAILCLGDLVGMVLKEQSLYQPQHDLDRVGARVSQPKAHLWAWVLARQVRSNHWGHQPWVQCSQLP